MHEINNIVNCWKKGLVYKARIIAIKRKFICIHYIGWDKCNEEWISKKCLYLKKNKGKKKQTKKIENTDQIKIKKCFQDIHEIILSNRLILQLVNDWKKITNQKMLCRLPAEKNFLMIINEYKEFIKEKKKEFEDTVSLNQECKFLSGLKNLFEVSLGKHLLYPFERLQYTKLFKKKKRVLAKNLYGAEHLLRLLSKLGSFLSDIKIKEKDRIKILKNAQNLLLYIHTEGLVLFKEENYEFATPGYIRAIS